MALKQSYRLGHLAFFGIIFYVSKIMGLLPANYDFRNSFKNRHVRGEPFYHSVSGTILSWLHLINQLWTSYNIVSFCIRTAIERKVSCMQGNSCAIYGIFISHVVVATLITASTIVNSEKIVRCLNSMHLLLKIRDPCYSQLPFAAFSILAFTVLLTIRLVLNARESITYPLFYYGFYMSYFSPIVLLNLVALLALAAENVFKQINHEIAKLFDEPYQWHYTHSRISYLAQTHLDTIDFMNNISSCFGFSLLLAICDCFISFVLFLYLSIWNVIVEGLFIKSFYPFVSAIIEILTIVFKIVFLCYRCQKSSEMGDLTLWYLQRLINRDDLSPSCHQQIRLFIFQLRAQPIKITALNLFSLNMELLFKILGIVSTYFIVLIQFQISEGNSEPTTPKKPQVCNVWPCLG